MTRFPRDLMRAMPLEVKGLLYLTRLVHGRVELVLFWTLQSFMQGNGCWDIMAMPI